MLRLCSDRESRVSNLSLIFLATPALTGQSTLSPAPPTTAAPPPVTYSSQFSEKEKEQRATLRFSNRQPPSALSLYLSRFSGKTSYHPAKPALLSSPAPPRPPLLSPPAKLALIEMVFVQGRCFQSL
ncbi:hypothetical protein JCGZ_07893 [Jatropha curcas]|uniref:Uncharacterized protein n=1 Tax=Jatropha curcas TaxID=180498 RepID=A0A067KWN5_JATCU|nr:hypothetical protein JCGZ_07893 [Jatropha curcas]